MEEVVVDDERAQLIAELREHTMYELLGAEEGLRRIVDAFYSAMADDAEFATIRQMHAADLAPMRVALLEFLSGWIGGPPLYIQRHGSPCITEAHAPFVIDAEAARQWLACMDGAMETAGVAARYRNALLPALGGIADMLRNEDRPRFDRSC